MNRTIPQLIPRFARIGLELAPVPDTTPQLWTVRDPITGEVEDFGGGPPKGGYGDHLATIRVHLYQNHSPMSLRETRVRVLFEQGKNIAETADILGCGRGTVAVYRKKLRLPAKDPRVSKGPRGSRKTRALRYTPAQVEAERLLREGVIPAEVARCVHLSRQRVCQIRDVLGLPHLTPSAARRDELAELVAEGVVDAKTLADGMGCTVSQVRTDAQRLGLTIETGADRIAKRRALITRLSKQGLPIATIAERAGCSVGTVINDRAKLGVAPKRNMIGAEGVQARRERVAALLDEGMSQRQIRDRLALRAATVSADLKFLHARGAQS